MAQRSPIRIDSVHYDDSDSGLGWSDLRAAASRPGYRGTARRPLSSMVWVAAVVVIAGFIAVLMYKTYSSSIGASAPSATNDGAPEASFVPGRSLAKETTRVRSRSGPASPAMPQLQSASPPATLARTMPEISPAAYIDVVTSAGHVPIRIASIAYRVDIKSGTVQLIHSDAGLPVTGKAEFPMYLQTLKAFDKSVEGTVVLRVFTDKQGRVREWHLVSGAPALAVAAIDAVRQWQFASTDKLVPAEHEMTVTVSFKTSP